MEPKFGYNAIVGPAVLTVEFVLLTNHWLAPIPTAYSPHKCPSLSEDSTQHSVSWYFHFWN